MHAPAAEFHNPHISLRIKINTERLLQWIRLGGQRPALTGIPTAVNERHLGFSSARSVRDEARGEKWKDGFHVRGLSQVQASLAMRGWAGIVRA